MQGSSRETHGNLVFKRSRLLRDKYSTLNPFVWAEYPSPKKVNLEYLAGSYSPKP